MKCILLKKCKKTDKEMIFLDCQIEEAALEMETKNTS